MRCSILLGVYFSSLSLIFYPREELANGMYYREGYPLMAASAGLIAFTSIMLCVWGTRNVIPQLSTAVPSSEKLSIRRIVGELKLAFLSPSYRSIFLGLLLGMVVIRNGCCVGGDCSIGLYGYSFLGP